MFNLLKEKEKDKIVLIRLGSFYIAIGEDAVYLEMELGLKCICFQKQICKIGIPINSLSSYLKKLENSKKSYVVYDIDEQNKIMIKKFEYKGNYHNICRKNKNCLICKGIDIYKEDKYMEIFKNTLEKEIKENGK